MKRPKILFKKNLFKDIKKKKVYIYTVSTCSRRLLDAQRIKNYCEKNNYEMTFDPKRADFIIVNSCALEQSTEDNSIEVIKRLKSNKGKLIVAGCISKINKERLKNVHNGPTLSPTTLGKIEKIIPKRKVAFADIPDSHKFYISPFPGTNHGVFSNIRDKFKSLNILSQKNEKIFYVRVSQGCLGNCSYCGIKKAIGRLQSKPLNLCLSEFEEGLKQGYKNFQIVGDDTGAYGIDIGLNFCTLLKEILKIHGDFKLDLGETNPIWFNLYADSMKEIFLSPKIIKITIPIQSASKKILKMMRRDTNIKKTKEMLLYLKKIRPDIEVITHILIGFPGETEEDLKKTLSFIKEAGFSTAKIYKFAVKENTEAAFLPGKVSDILIDRRIKKAERFFKKHGILFDNPLSLDEEDEGQLPLEKINLKDFLFKPKSSLVAFNLLILAKTFSLFDRYGILQGDKLREKVIFFLCDISKDHRYLLNKLMFYLKPISNQKFNYQTKIEIHSTISHKNLSHYILAINSLQSLSDVKFPIVVHDDGSLSSQDMVFLKTQIPEIKIINFKKSTEIMKKVLKNYPYLLEYRLSNYKNPSHLINTIDIPYFAESKYIIYLDSKVLFFKKPRSICNWVLKNKNKNKFLYMKDYVNDYVLSNIQCQNYFKVGYLNKFNIGILCYTKSILDLDKLNRYFSLLKLLGKDAVNSRDQTYLMILAQKKYKIIMPLNKNYVVSFAGEKDDKTVCYHYENGESDKFYKDAILLLLKLHCLK
jgi:threonylcarbamoyladenosine tRNA methylthiotransferase CDKAL1